MSKFRKDLEFGQNYEKKFIEIMKPKSSKIIGGNFKYWDLEIFEDYKVIKYEIKSDRLAHKTNNLCIEFECNKKPSGITTTQADYYGYFIIKDKDEFQLYNIPTKFIRECINNKLYSRTMNGGDGYKSKFYLFDKNIFSEYIIKNG